MSDLVDLDFAGLEQRPILRLSQGHLALLSTCPRKFQQAYLDQLGAPATLEQQARMEWGTRFHLVMQQRELGLPVDLLTQADPQLQQCFQGLLQTAPQVFWTDDTTLRLSEHRRSLDVGDYCLTVVYDLLLLQPEQAQILDWKTYPRPPRAYRLERDWQTRLYLFVLAETTEYLPEQLSMTYWFVQHQTDQGQAVPQNWAFAYSTDQHEATRQELTHCLQQLTEWLVGYERGEAFPQVEVTDGHCTPCGFARRCQRVEVEPADSPTGLLDFSEIQEVVL